MKYELSINGLKKQFDIEEGCFAAFKSVLLQYFSRNKELFYSSGYLKEIDELYKRKRENKTIRDDEIVVSFRLEKLFEMYSNELVSEDEILSFINKEYEVESSECHISINAKNEVEIKTKSGIIKTNIFDFDYGHAYFMSTIGENFELVAKEIEESIEIDNLEDLLKNNN